MDTTSIEAIVSTLSGSLVLVYALYVYQKKEQYRLSCDVLSAGWSAYATVHECSAKSDSSEEDGSSTE